MKPRSSQDSFAPKAHGFTLIELLTVIAIIGILAAILIPVVSAVRDSAKSSVCLSNLRQMGFATLMYADDNNHRLPTVRSDNFDDLGRLIERLESYASLDRRETERNGQYAYDGVWRCPTGPAEWRFTYLPNPYISEIAVTAIDEPTRFILYRDRGGKSGDEPKMDLKIWDPAWHGNKHNVVMADAHTATLTRAELEEMRGRERLLFTPYPGFRPQR